jgi:hypothetical protein
MQKLYANNRHDPVEVSDEDAKKIGRGYDLGYSFGTVQDVNTSKVYQALQAGCNLPTCNCAIDLIEVV